MFSRNSLLVGVLFSIFIFFDSAFAGSFTINPYRFSAGGACSTPTTGSLMNEGYLGAGYENTWVEVLTNGTIDEDFTLSGSPPTGSCTEGAQFVANTSGGGVSAYWDNGSAIDTSLTVLDFYFSFYINSFTIDANQYIWLLTWASGNANQSDGEAFAVSLVESSGNINLVVKSTVDSTEIPLSTSTWYECVVHIDGGTPTSSYIQLTGGGSTTCDAVGECTFTHTDADGRYLWLGPDYNLGVGEAVTMETGYVYIDQP